MPSDSMVTVENIIYGSFVKHNRLEQIVFNTFSNTSIAGATELNVFIDLYSVLKSVFSQHFRTDISDYTAITSGIVNMCSHYRSFFNRLSVHTKFYLIFSYNTCDLNRKFVAEYNNEFLRKSQIKMYNEMAESNFSLLEVLCPYLPDIFLIKSTRNYEVSVIIANLIETLNDGNPNLIISKDLYPLQLCTLYPYTSYLYPIKKKGGIDDSVMIPISEKPTFRKEFWRLVSIVRNMNESTMVNLSPLNFTLFSALNRFPERNMLPITNIPTAKKIIKNIVGEEDIKIYPSQLYNDMESISTLPVASVESRFKALDIGFMLPYYKNDPESKCIKFENLRDDGAINAINAKFFSENPLDLNKL